MKQKENKKQIIILSVGIILVVALVLGISYAYIKYETKQKESNVVGTECLSISLLDESEAITLEKTYPITDEAGHQLKPYTFTVKNNCDTVVDYSVNLETLENELQMNSKYIAVAINEEEKKILTEYQEGEHTYVGVESHILLTSFLEPNGSERHSLKLWVDESADNGSQNKTFLSKVVIEGTPNEVIAESTNMNVINLDANGEEIRELSVTNNYAYETRTIINCAGEKQTCYFKTTKEVETTGSILESCGTEEEPGECTPLTEPITITPNTWYKIKSNITIRPKEEEKETIQITGKTCVGTECSEKVSKTMASQDKNAPSITIGEISSNYQGARIPFEANDTESGIESITCKYGLNEDNLDLEGTIENNICTLSNFVIDKTYYYAIEGIDKVGNVRKATGSISSKETVTSPILSGGGVEFASSRTVSTETEGSADTGVASYEYYVTRENTTPSSEVTISGTGESVTINEEGTWYVYFRTVSNAGNKSSWSGAEEVNIYYKASSVGYTNPNDTSIKTVQDVIDKIRKGEWS